MSHTTSTDSESREMHEFCDPIVRLRSVEAVQELQLTQLIKVLQ